MAIVVGCPVGVPLSFGACVGALTAAVALSAGSHRGRVRSEAALALLADLLNPGFFREIDPFPVEPWRPRSPRPGQSDSEPETWRASMGQDGQQDDGVFESNKGVPFVGDGQENSSAGLGGGAGRRQ